MLQPSTRADQYRLSGLVCLDDPVDDRLILAFLMRVYRVFLIRSDDRPVGRDNDNVHVVDISELVFLCLGSTRHS